MAKIESFRELVIWQKSIDLAVRCHRLAKRFPRDEQSVLGYHTRKSSLSMPSNIAEGFARHSTASYIQHLWTAHASGAELQSQLIVGSRIEVVSEADASALIADAEEVGRNASRSRRISRARALSATRLSVLAPDPSTSP